MTRTLFQGYRNSTVMGENNDSHNSSNDTGRDVKRQQQDELMEEITLSYMIQMEENSEFFSEDFKMKVSSRLIPQFSPAEIQLGTMVGMGEYGTVTKVVAFHLSPEDGLNNDERTEKESSEIQGLHPIKVVESALTVGNDVTKTQQQQHHQQQRRKLFPSNNCLPTFPPQITTTIEQAPKSWGAEESLVIQDKDAALSQSITIAQLANPTMPLNERDSTVFSSSRIRRRSSILSPSASAMSGSAMEQSLRRQIAEEAMDTCCHRHHHHDGTTTASVTDSGTTRFSLKQVRKDLYFKKKCEAAKDLAREAKFLARFSHPNIICLRGIVSHPGKPSFGILLDRLRITLSEEALLWKSKQSDIVLKSRSALVTPIEAFASNLASKWPFWQPHDNNNSNKKSSDVQADSSRKTPQRSYFHSHQYSNDAILLLGERLLALHDISQALEYLQNRKIIFRDLKPENCAMLGRSRFQLFDFGLAKECKAIDRYNVYGGQIDGNQNVKTTNRTHEELHATALKSNDPISGDPIIGFYDSYKMTGLTGTLRIMSPETIQCLPYGLPADVFSFSICMWEVFTGDRCSFLTAGDVVRGDRPPVPPFDSQCGVGLPTDLASFMIQCWAADPTKRPNFVTIGRELKSQLLNLRKTGSTPSAGRDSITPSGQGSFWDRLESIQQPTVFDQSSAEIVTMVQ